MKQPSTRDRRAASLLDRALRLEFDERADFLDRACADDLELRRQVEAPLAAHGGADGTVGAPCTDAAGETTDSTPTAGELVGRTLGPTTSRH